MCGVWGVRGVCVGCGVYVECGVWVVWVVWFVCGVRGVRVVCGVRGARGFGRVRRWGVAGAPPATKGMRHPQHFVKIEVFS